MSDKTGCYFCNSLGKEQCTLHRNTEMVGGEMAGMSSMGDATDALMEKLGDMLKQQVESQVISRDAGVRADEAREIYDLLRSAELALRMGQTEISHALINRVGDIVIPDDGEQTGSGTPA